MQLHERYRPRCWSEVVGQPKVLAQIELLRRGGLGGRAYWISGQSGTGKTTIARLLADEVADDWATLEVDGGQVDTALLDGLERAVHSRPIGKSRCWIVNEAHGLKAAAIRRLLCVLEPGRPLPAWVTVVFTTTNEGEGKLFEDYDDAHPLLSRCTVLGLARRDLTKPFAERLRQVAQAEGLDGQPIEKYVRLLQQCRNNLRQAMQRVESGEMLAGPAGATGAE